MHVKYNEPADGRWFGHRLWNEREKHTFRTNVESHFKLKRALGNLSTQVLAIQAVRGAPVTTFRLPVAVNKTRRRGFASGFIRDVTELAGPGSRTLMGVGLM